MTMTRLVGSIEIGKLLLMNCGKLTSTWTENGNLILLLCNMIGAQTQCGELARIKNTLLCQRLPTLIVLTKEDLQCVTEQLYNWKYCDFSGVQFFLFHCYKITIHMTSVHHSSHSSWVINLYNSTTYCSVNSKLYHYYFYIFINASGKRQIK